jgi:hypothetical protein
MSKAPPRRQRAVFDDIPLPGLSLGDLVAGRTMGACTAAHATDLNFIPRTRIVAVNRRPGRQRAD